VPSELGEFASFAAAALSTAAGTRQRNGRHVPAVTADVVAVLVQVAAADGVGRRTRDRPAPGRQPEQVPAATSLLVTPLEAASLLQISPRTLRALRAAGQIEQVRIAGATRYRRSDIEVMAAAGPRSFRADIVAKDTPEARSGATCSRGVGPINEPGAAA
jgi:hypothetical protein